MEMEAKMRSGRDTSLPPQQLVVSRSSHRLRTGIFLGKVEKLAQELSPWNTWKVVYIPQAPGFTPSFR